MIRPAVPEDAEAIGALHHRAFWHAYEDLLPFDALTARSREDWVEAWAELVAETNVLVYVGAGEAVAGAVAFGPARGEPGLTSGVGELRVLYVDPPAQGAGVGRSLHDAALTALVEEGCSSAVLWVFEGNGHGRAFYASAGWVVDGEPVVKPGWAVPAVRLRKALVAA